MALIDRGKVFGTGGTKEIFADPGTRVGAVLTGCKNIVRARKSGEYEVEVPEWGICLKTGKPVGDHVCAIGIRAHYFNSRARENVFPVVYAVVKHWMEAYTRQMEMSVFPFLTVFLLMTVVVAASIGQSVWRAANENPAEVVKSE